MVGLGETDAEMTQAFMTCARMGCDPSLTIGQYLRPSESSTAGSSPN